MNPRQRSSTVSLAPQPLLGKYQLLRRLAVGGMAEIFLARSIGIKGFQKLVVLKRILPQYSVDGNFIRMFLEEARLAATLHHSNIAQVYDIGRVGGVYFFTMEYIHGVDVRQILRRVENGPEGRIPLEHAIAIVLGTAAGLHYAHEKVGVDGEPLGIVHRDVSPANVLVGYDGSVKLVDFGIAKATYQPSKTRPGVRIGKLAYMAPEQCVGGPLDRRTDVFAAGILLYELTTGTPLFAAENEAAIAYQIVHGTIAPPSSCVSDYPPELEKIVLTALDKDPGQRYRTAQELQRALELFAHEKRLLVSPVSFAQYLEQLFGKELDAWRAAQRDGEELVKYLTSVSDPGLAQADTAAFGNDSVSLMESEPSDGVAPAADPFGGGEVVYVETSLTDLEPLAGAPRKPKRSVAGWAVASLVVLSLVGLGAFWLPRFSRPTAARREQPVPPVPALKLAATVEPDPVVPSPPAEESPLVRPPERSTAALSRSRVRTAHVKRHALKKSKKPWDRDSLLIP